MPKTASESVRTFLDPYCDVQVGTFSNRSDAQPFYSHMRPEEASTAFAKRGWNFVEFYRFMTVRNPWDRLASLYFMIQRNRGLAIDKRGFVNWIDRLDPNHPSLPSHAAAKWISHGTMSVEAFASGAANVSLVQDFYRIEDELPKLKDTLSSMGIPTDGRLMPFLNRSDATYDYKELYTATAAARVLELYGPEIERFKYGLR